MNLLLIFFLNKLTLLKNTLFGWEQDLKEMLLKEEMSLAAPGKELGNRLFGLFFQRPSTRLMG